MPLISLPVRRSAEQIHTRRGWASYELSQREHLVYGWGD